MPSAPPAGYRRSIIRTSAGRSRLNDLAQVKGASLIEIHSGHPLVNMLGGGGVPGVEEMWDTLLTKGLVFYGVAVDDVHHLKRLGDQSAATPGHGWVMVRVRGPVIGVDTRGT